MKIDLIQQRLALLAKLKSQLEAHKTIVDGKCRVATVRYYVSNSAYASLELYQETKDAINALVNAEFSRRVKEIDQLVESIERGGE